MKKKLEDIFRIILQSSEMVEGTDKNAIEQIRLWGRIYSLTKWDEKKYNEQLARAIKLHPNNSPSFIEIHFSSSIAKILASTDKKSSITSESERLIDFIAWDTKKRTTCIPIQGLDLRPELIEFGFGTLYRSDIGVLPELISDRNTWRSYQHGINALENCKCYFKFESNTDHEHSVALAKKHASYLTALLSLHIGSARYRGNNTLTPWYKRDKTSTPLRKRKIEVYGAESGKDQVYYTYYKNDEPYKKSEYSLELNLLTSGHDANESINECLEVFHPEKAKTTYHLINDEVAKTIFSEKNKHLLTCLHQESDIEKRLYQSVIWFGKAVNSDSPEDQLLFFAVSIESLLVGDEPASGLSSQGSITQKISERAAFLIGNEFNERIKIEKEVKRIYGIRSKIVHTGGKTESTDVIKAENIARTTILRFSQNKFTSHHDFLKWIKERQYS